MTNHAAQKDVAQRCNRKQGEDSTSVRSVFKREPPINANGGAHTITLNREMKGLDAEKARGGRPLVPALGPDTGDTGKNGKNVRERKNNNHSITIGLAALNTPGLGLVPTRVLVCA